jgi:3',5'-cyclic AMP phosphodiesterase CpdA
MYNCGQGSTRSDPTIAVAGGGVSKIIVTSDLHLGITPIETVRALARQIAAKQPDLTILAGDLGEGPTNLLACLALFGDLPGRVAVLAGNHDVWARGGLGSQQLWERELPRVVREAGMIWLEEDAWRDDDVTVIGSLAWYDYSAVDPRFAQRSAAEFAARKHEFNLDGRKIDWTWGDAEFASQLGAGLCRRLDDEEADSTIRATLLVTHVPIFEQQMCRKPLDARWGYTNAYFGNLTLGRRVIGASKLRQVISGHTHVGREGLVSRSRLNGAGDLPVMVLASDYGKPVYHVVQTDDWP